VNVPNKDSNFRPNNIAAPTLRTAGKTGREGEGTDVKTLLSVKVKLTVIRFAQMNK